MKKFSPAFVLLSISFIIVFFSCKKINEATDLGGDLIPGVDNISTFEVALNTVTQNLLTSDSVKVNYYDYVALGDINDPEFGHVHANFCFNVSAASYGSYPFLPRSDTIHAIDSVVLSLAYTKAYGDTLADGVQTVNVYEIPFTGQSTSLSSDSAYRYNDPASDFTGTQLGSATFTINNLKDSITVINPGDTFKVAKVVRIKLDPSLGSKLAQMDATPSTGGYYSDSLFRTIFNGLAIKAANSGNALSYFNLTDTSTKLIVYYKYNRNGKDTAGIVQYYHSAYGQSNYVNVQPGSNWASSINNSAADKVYIQSSPSGSYASVVIPFLDTLGNKVIHRAEIIATRVSSAGDNIFTTPPQLFLDRIRNNGDSSYLFEKDITLDNNGSLVLTNFGGRLTNNMYRFNITRYIQAIVTRKESNDTLRLWAPLRVWEFDKALISSTYPNGVYVGNRPVNTLIAEGRVVLAGGTYPDPNTRLRLRIVYSNL